MLAKMSKKLPAAMQVTKTRLRIALFVALLPTLPLLAEAQTQMGQRHQFMGNPQCADWSGMSPAARFEWTTVFLSTLSMGLENSRSRGKQKYRNHEGVDEVVTAINAHCVANPQAQASEAAAPFLNP